MPAIFRRLALVAAAAAGAVAVCARAQEIPPRLDWQVERLPGDAAGQVQLTFSYRTEHHASSDSHSAQLGDLAGLTEAQLGAPTLTLVRFALRRDAGDFDCDGSARAERASGSCDFHANPAFSTFLQSRGIGSAEPSDLFQLAYANIGRAYVDELARQGYATPAIDDLRRAGQHGVSLTYLRDMGAAGYRADSLANLVRLRDHGVSLRYVQELRAAGYAHPSIEEVLRARDHGVSAQFLTGLADQGYRGLPLDTVVRMRDHGVTASFVGRANAELAQGGRKLEPDELISLRDRGGLYVRARERRDDR
jgi:hypothetical protein